MCAIFARQQIEVAEFKALFANLVAPAKLQVRFRAKREQREKFYLKAEARISQGRNLALTVLYVPSLLESGCGGNLRVESEELEPFREEIPK